MSESTRYVVLRSLGNTNKSQLLVSRLRAEGIDVRVFHDNSSSIYPLWAMMDMRLEVAEHQVEEAQSLLEQMEQSARVPNPDIDFRDADHADIEFERQIYENEKKMEGIRPLNLIYLLIGGLLLLSLAFAALYLYRPR